jgi:hypothetical protein
MKKKLLFVLVLSFATLSSCLNCADCSECVDEAYDVELCYGDHKDYYQSRKEWRDDVKRYEDTYDCKCR